jgi:hypothetical protein
VVARADTMTAESAEQLANAGDQLIADAKEDLGW